MNLENIRYYISVTLLVLACSVLPSGIIMLGIKEIIHLDKSHLNIIHATTYTLLVIIGLKLYTPRMRGVI